MKNKIIISISAGFYLTFCFPAFALIKGSPVNLVLRKMDPKAITAPAISSGSAATLAEGALPTQQWDAGIPTMYKPMDGIRFFNAPYSAAQKAAIDAVAGRTFWCVKFASKNPGSSQAACVFVDAISGAILYVYQE